MKAVLTVLGRDRVGIIAHMSNALAKEDVNILDLSQTVLGGDTFTMVMLVDLDACALDIRELGARLEASAREIGMTVRLQRSDIFDAMHRV